jgi:hypothetical protein
MSDTRSLDWRLVEGCLPTGWRELAANMKMVKANLPKHLGAKVTDIGQVPRLALYQVARNVGQQTAAAAFAAAGLLATSHVALRVGAPNAIRPGNHPVEPAEPPRQGRQAT